MTLTIRAGQTKTPPGSDFTYSCARGTDCKLTITATKVTYTGGMVTADYSTAYKASRLRTVTFPTGIATNKGPATTTPVTIRPGNPVTRGNVTYTCTPASGSTSCSLTVKSDGTATSTGGTVTARNSATYERTRTRTGTFPAGTSPNRGTGTHTITRTLTLGDVIYTCTPAPGSTSCRLTITSSGFTSTGGTVTAANSQAYANRADQSSAANIATAQGRYQGIKNRNTSGGSKRDAKLTASGDTRKVTVTIGSVDTDLTTETSLPALGNWKGGKFSLSDNTKGIYEAHVYSLRGAPTSETLADKYPELTSATSKLSDSKLNSNIQHVRVNLDGFTGAASGAGVSYKDRGTASTLEIPGWVQGVPGTFTCSAVSEKVCAVQLTNSGGYQLGGVDKADKGNFVEASATWTFKPNDRNARITTPVDNNYLYYGWWSHKKIEANGEETWMASSFTNAVGTGPTPGAGNVQGTATYKGTAAGYYAISTPQSGDSGPFTAEVQLEANFSSKSITGTIDKFKGSDGAARNWSVELMESNLDTSTSTNTSGAITPKSGTKSTKWTINGTAAAASGSWKGRFYDLDTTQIPRLATGTFFSTYNNSGRMVGAFGVEREDNP